MYTLKVFKLWRANAPYATFTEHRKLLGRRLFALRPTFASPLQQIQAVCCEMYGVRLSAPLSQNLVTLEHFADSQAAVRVVAHCRL